MARGERSGRRFSPLVIIAPGVLLAAIFLGTYSYRYAAQLASKSETTLVESYRLLGDQTRDRIDNFIIDSDRAMFDLVDLEHLADFSRPWNYIVNVSPAIEAAVVLDENQQLLPGGYVSKKKVAAHAEAFKLLFLTKILPDLRLADLRPDMHKHLHKEYDGRDYLISFIKKEAHGTTFYVVLKISLEYLLKELFPSTLEPLQGKALYCVRDDHGRVVFGAPVGQPGKFLYEKAFPTTLFLWRLQLAPLPAASLATAEKTRRRSEYLLITLTLGIILAGTLFLFT